MAPPADPDEAAKKAEESQQPMSHASVTEAPDPGEDDLDDLDDMLDDFTLQANKDATHAPVKVPTTIAQDADTASALPASSNSEEDEFARQLASGMEDLLGELQSSPEMQKHFEGLMKELGEAGIGKPETAAGPSTASQPPSIGANRAPESDAAFQDTIRKTMERMQESGEQATAAASADEPDDILSEMLKQLQGENVDGAESDEDISKMIMGMMEQLTNKDILYDPMKELYEKFPSWMESNKSKVSEEDMKRYQEQQRLVTEIVAKFETKGYSDDNAADREYIVDRMQKMQAAGSPPADLVGDMSGAQQALGDLDAGCAQQ